MHVRAPGVTPGDDADVTRMNESSLYTDNGVADLSRSSGMSMRRSRRRRNKAALFEPSPSHSAMSSFARAHSVAHVGTVTPPGQSRAWCLTTSPALC